MSGLTIVTIILALVVLAMFWLMYELEQVDRENRRQGR